jgi:hypothetical protein
MSDEDGSKGFDPLRNLFACARPREAPPVEIEREIGRAVFAEWNALTGRRVLRRRLGIAAWAAVLVSVVALLLRTTTAPAAVVASVERVRGSVEVAGAALTVGSRIPSATRIETRGGQLALRLEGGGSLRLAPQTALLFTTAGEATLYAGAVYFDSEGVSAARRIEVHTALGNVREVGTQFVVHVAPDRLEVGVRDGRVAIAGATESIDVHPGERVSVMNSGVESRRETIATYGTDWEWAERLAPPFAIDGRRLIDFLRWVAAQTGRTLTFADAASELAARKIALGGSIDLEPLLELAAVIATTDLGYSLEAERIVIRASK